MKQIGAEIGVNESRVSQLHARAIKRLRTVLADMAPAEAMTALKGAVLAFHQRSAIVDRPSSVVEKPAAIVDRPRPQVPVVAFKPARASMRRPFMAHRVASARVAVAAAR
jgi:hypothetical protein